MMNNKLLIGIIIVLVLGAGGYFLIDSQKSTSDKLTLQSHRSYKIEVTSSTGNVKPNQKATIKYKIKNDKGEILKNYETVHEKIMHFITVRKDLQYFQHLHPDFNKSTGEFTVNITFQTDGPYRIFPDFTPGENNPQKLPVTVFQDIDVGYIGEYRAKPITQDKDKAKIYDEYEVITTFPKDTKKQTEITYSLNISKNGIPITNLDNYLGALGHSVILKEGTLDFIHTHALDAKSVNASQGHGQQQAQHGSSTQDANQGPEISFSATFPESGVYKIFTQFQYEGKLLTVDYAVKTN